MWVDLDSGSEDDQIVCLRKGQPCEKGMEMLKTNENILSEVPVDPFTLEDSYVKGSQGFK